MSDPDKRPADPFGMGMVNGDIVTMTEDEARKRMAQIQADEAVDDYMDSIDEIGDIEDDDHL